MKKSKKLFLFGKLRDLDSATFMEYVKKDIAEYVGTEDIPFYMLPGNDGAIQFVIGISGEEGPIKDDVIPLSIARLIFGESKAFKPENPVYTGLKWPGFENSHVSIDKAEYIKSYKANNKFYGGSRMKSVDFSSDVDMRTVITIKW